MQKQVRQLCILDHDEARAQSLRRLLSSGAQEILLATSKDTLFSLVTTETSLVVAALSTCLPNLLAFTTQLVEQVPESCLLLLQEEANKDFLFDSLALLQYPQESSKLQELLQAQSRGELLPISYANLTDTLELLRLEKQSALLVLRQDNEVGELYVQHGELVHVHCGALTGMPALEKLFSWDHVSLEERAWQPPSEATSTSSTSDSLPSTSALLLQESFAPQRVPPPPSKREELPTSALSSEEAADLLLAAIEDIPVMQVDDAPEEVFDPLVSQAQESAETLLTDVENPLVPTTAEETSTPLSSNQPVEPPTQDSGALLASTPNESTKYDASVVVKVGADVIEPETIAAKDVDTAVPVVAPTEEALQGEAANVQEEASQRLFVEEPPLSSQETDDVLGSATKQTSPFAPSDQTSSFALFQQEIPQQDDEVAAPVALEDNESWLASFQAQPVVQDVTSQAATSSPFAPSVEITGGFWMQFPEEELLQVAPKQEPSASLPETESLSAKLTAKTEIAAPSKEVTSQVDQTEDVLSSAEKEQRTVEPSSAEPRENKLSTQQPTSHGSAHTETIEMLALQLPEESASAEALLPESHVLQDLASDVSRTEDAKVLQTTEIHVSEVLETATRSTEVEEAELIAAEEEHDVPSEILVEDGAQVEETISPLDAALAAVVDAEEASQEVAIVSQLVSEEAAQEPEPEHVFDAPRALDETQILLEAVDNSVDNPIPTAELPTLEPPEEPTPSDDEPVESDQQPERMIEGTFDVSSDPKLPVVGIEPEIVSVAPLLPSLSATLAAAAANETLWESTVVSSVTADRSAQGIESLLGELLEEIPGAVHVAVLERESGLTLGVASGRETVAAEEALAYYAELWNTMESSAWFSTMGTECLVNTDSFALLLRPIGREFLLGVVLHRKSNVGIGRSILRKSAATFLELLPGSGSV